MSFSVPNKKTDPDIVTVYNKHIHGTSDLPSKRWIDALEEQIIMFLAKLFYMKGFDKPLKNSTKYFEECLEESGAPVKDSNLVLFSIASQVNTLNEELLDELLPMMANLIFLTKHDFRGVRVIEARKLVARFQEMVSAAPYLASETPNGRLKKLMDAVDSVRKYAEYLLRSSGYSLQVARSPRDILREISFVRSHVQL